jgi:hypothetical protein
MRGGKFQKRLFSFQRTVIWCVANPPRPFRSWYVVLTIINGNRLFAVKKTSCKYTIDNFERHFFKLMGIAEFFMHIGTF